MHVDYLAAIASDVERIAVAGETAPATRVPSCPEWDLAGLCEHLGRVHRMATAAMSSPNRPDLSLIEPPTPGQEAAYLRAGVAPLLAAAAARAPQDPAWNFTGTNQVVEFWHRRQANEALVHRWDAENALGLPSELPLAHAVDGLEEALTVMLPRRLQRIDLGGITGTIHLHCTDTGTETDIEAHGEWTLVLSEGAMAVQPGHAKGDVAARGPAQSLLLLTMGRLGSDHQSLEIFGDRPLLDGFLGLLH
ncbi:MAG: hypothetical protein JWL70_2768 [Acidimicrobiia bacterium]|nr:hypothetical protein [Acidimicrobiia bacterium]